MPASFYVPAVTALMYPDEQRGVVAEGTGVCASAGVAAVIANITAKRNSRRCEFMLPSLGRQFTGSIWTKLHSLPRRGKGVHGVCTRVTAPPD